MDNRVVISAIVSPKLYERLERRYKSQKEFTFEELVAKYIEIGVEAEKMLR